MKLKFKKRNTLLLIGLMGALSLPAVAANNGLVGSTVYEVCSGQLIPDCKIGWLSAFARASPLLNVCGRCQL
tara:strand:+ start:479 stop:694 length:216 start_codon:yes stop_codon:yes gene_type:complete